MKLPLTNKINAIWLFIKGTKIVKLLDIERKTQQLCGETSSGSNMDTTEDVDVQTGGQQHTKEIRTREQQILEVGQQGPGTC